MKLLSLLFPLVSLVCFAAYVWLVVVAFKRSALWGVLVLLLSPFSAVVFAIRYWEEAKKPFLTYAGSCLASIALVVVTFGFMGGFEIMSMASRAQSGEEISDEEVAAFMEKTMDRMENSGMLDEQELEDLQKTRNTLDDIRNPPSPEEPAEPGATTPRTASERNAKPAVLLVDEDLPEVKPIISPRSRSRNIPLALARDYVGELVEVETRDGYRYEGRLSLAGRDELSFERHVTGGIFSVDIDRADIKWMRVAGE